MRTRTQVCKNEPEAEIRKRLNFQLRKIENKPKFLPGAMIALDNTGVTKTGVVERGALRRDEAREN